MSTPTDLPVQPSLRRLRQFGVRPNRELGQNFLVDSNLLHVIGRLAQLACDVRVARPVSRNVFRPVPNVDSVLAVLDRRAPAASPEVRELARAAFAHRRKALAGSLALAPGAPGGVRERARAALEEMGLPADARAERLAPEQFEALAQALT